jgi:hypothetical protein
LSPPGGRASAAENPKQQTRITLKNLIVMTLLERAGKA